MIKYLIRLIFAALFLAVPAMSAHSAEMVNVEYIHQYLNARWGIDLPYNPELENPKVAANMEYLLTVVDIANEYLNGGKTTSYGTGEYATKLAADTIATNTAIDSLVHGPSFYITTTPDTTEFHIIIAAAGDFIINWGDREYEFISDKQLGKTVYSHTYSAPGEYLIRLSGTATDYYNNGSYSYIADIAFHDYPAYATNSQHIAKISGSLGNVFPTLPDGTNPTFYSTFSDAENLTEIPDNLFENIHGAPVPYMFSGTFANTGITQIPENLFAGISGAPTESMFSMTFQGSPITSIPETLFSSISGKPAKYMFNNTFTATNITSIPEKLFSSLSGPPAESMFTGTFMNTKITSIPENLFATIQGRPAKAMFHSTFDACQLLTSVPEKLFANIKGAPVSFLFNYTFRWTKSLKEIPENLFASISGAPATALFDGTFMGGGLTQIPENLFANISGTPATQMFTMTFQDTPITGIPENLFAGISGTPADSMFNGTFQDTPITSIPENLFGNLSGPAARNMFNYTFSGCTSLTGPSAQIDGQYLYEIWPDISTGTYTYRNATGLSDYEQIPANWK